MRRLFMVGAKLLGIYLVLEGIVTALMMFQPGLIGGMSGPSRMTGYVAVICFVYFIAGTILTFFTAAVAAAARIPDFDDETPQISIRAALEVGIDLIGLFKLLTVLPQLALQIEQLISTGRSPESFLVLFIPIA